MKITTIAGAALLLAAAALPIAGRAFHTEAAPNAGPSAATFDVSADDNFFSPSSVTIAVGDTVRWTNDGAIIHTVDDDGMLFSSGIMQVNDVFSWTYAGAGTFPYTCIVHSGMTGTVIVQQQSTATATTVAGTATPTRTRTATASPSPSVTPTVQGTVTPLPTLTPVTPPPPASPTAIVATPTRSGSAGPSVVAPNTGGGPSGGGSATDAAALALAVIGASMLATGALARRRAS